MYYDKIDHPANFSFIQTRRNPFSLGRRTFDFKAKDLGSDVHRVEIRGRTWKSSYSQAHLDDKAFHAGGKKSETASQTRVIIDGSAEIILQEGDREIFRTVRERSFGVCGTKWVLRFERTPEMRFYGMGEKSGGLEKSGVRTVFWNTDVAGDFPLPVVAQATPDPMYVSIPYLLVRRPDCCIGVLIDNPFPVFMNTGASEALDQSAAPDTVGEDLFIGATDGTPVIYLIYGKSVDEVTCKLQRLCGTTPLPPLWALGHHQSRWGYGSFADLTALADSFDANSIPNDGLWLDIDYMDGFRIFTVNPDALPDPAKSTSELAERGYRVVAILDPGVKLDDKFELYKDGLLKEVFCKNSEGRPYVGFVWPGATVFPDFSLSEVRAWWAERVASFVELGFAGFWLDMNDPSTGSSKPNEMLFGRGKNPHESYHNQYALGMQEATHAGLVAARPESRTFLMSRSGFISSSRFSALWTGDNVSNYENLAVSIPMLLNMSLSGTPFIGADVPGFGGDADAALATTWYKTAFLSPLLRNHSTSVSRRQEPWAFGARVTKIIGHYISLRYRLLPYLYNLFIDQEELGRPIWRPIFYEFGEDPGFDDIDDEFMVGPAILQAPIIGPHRNSRKVLLPEARWWSPWDRRWLRGGREITAVESAKSTPMFIREGSIIPMQPGARETNRNRLDEVEIHLFVSENYEGICSYLYRWDDGESLAYREGARSSILFTVSRDRKNLIVDAKVLEKGAGGCRVKFFVYGYFGAIILKRTEKDDELEALTLTSAPWVFAGTKVSPHATEVIALG
ncbi:MAG TPA: TIM-barrel domain-containing protein [Spirochaetia bacterium]|nr:TIM-barrel domain-containing protein [Spirochaetia bacterium]